MDIQTADQELRKVTIDNVVIGKVIGKGTHAKVHRGSWKGASCAVKEFETLSTLVGYLNEEDVTSLRASFIEECRRSIRLRHPNIVQFFGVYFAPLSGHMPCLVMELLHCNLTSFLEADFEISHKFKLSILHDISLGLRFLHTSSSRIIHRDLSSNNVLLSRGCVAKIGDLGAARLLNPHNQTLQSRMAQLSEQPGTADFMPPEAKIDNPQYGTPLDVFSFACVSLHTITQTWPTPTELDPMQPSSEALRRAPYLNRFVNEALLLKPLLLNCLKDNHNDRPDIVEVCQKLEDIKGPNYQPTLPLELDFGETAKLLPFWEGLQDLPKPEPISNAIQIGSKVYVASNSNIFRYKSNKNSWSTLPPPPVHHFCLARIISLKCLLVIGGRYQPQGMISSQALLWDADSKCWCDNIITSRMTVARYNAATADYQSSVIVLGGRIDDEQSTTQSVEVLKIVPNNLGASQWHTVASIPFGTALPMTVVISDRLYIAGGYMLAETISYMTSVYIPNLLSGDHADDVWSEVTCLPCTTSSFASYKDHLLVFGGDYVQCIRGSRQIWEFNSTIYLYYSQKNQWQVLPSYGLRHCFFRKCVNLTSTTIMFFGGKNNPSDISFLTTCEVLTITEQESVEEACVLQ